MSPAHPSDGRPLVSVVMATYNCATTVDAAVRSIVDQTFRHWELIVCDDGSTDGTFDALETWSAGDQRIRVLRNEQNRKLAFSLNRALAVAEGDLIARMDADDISVPHRLETQVAFLDEHRHIDLVGSAMRRFGSSGLADVVAVDPDPDRWSLRRGAPFCHATILARRAVFDRLGGYTDVPRTVRTEDLDLWFRFFAQGFRGANLPDELYLVREDLAAIRRRTFRNRLNVFLTTVYGYRLLGFPVTWYPRTVAALLKALVPHRLTALYRSVQHRQSRRRRRGPSVSLRRGRTPGGC